MQLDRTEIVIRARSALELFDLSLQVLKRHFLPIAMASGIIGIPLLVLDGLVVAWMLREETLLLAEHFELPLSAMRWRHSTHLILLFSMQFPLISLPTSVYLGNRIFFEPMPMSKLLRRLWPIAGRCFLVLGVMRLGLVGLIAEFFVQRNTTFDPTIELGMVIIVGVIAIVFRALWPFAPEILGLELCPLRSTQSGEIRYATRSHSLHSYLVSEHITRFMGAIAYSALLFFMLIAAQMFLIGACTGIWQWNAWFDYVGLLVSLWLVGLFMAVFRFLSYLDSRIRLEGWEIELRLMAEAERLAQSTPGIAQPKASLATAPPQQSSIGDKPSIIQETVS